MNERAMPKPNCTEQVEVGTIEFGRLGRRVVEGRFDGGSMTSDGGVMLLGQVDRKLGLLEDAGAASLLCALQLDPCHQAGASDTPLRSPLPQAT